MIRTAIAAAALFAATPAFAQEAVSPDLPEAEQVGDLVTVGLGVATTPDYEGADENRLIPGGFIRGQVGDIGFVTRGLALYVDVIAGGSGNMDWDFGPIVGVRLNRSGDVKDAVVDKLPELDMAIEVGGFGGVSFKGLTNPYDSLGLRLDVVTDVGGAHKSTIFTPNIDFSTPLSRTFFVSASLSADFVGGGYADYYYDVDPAGSAVSGLPVYDADGGMKNWKLGLLGNYALSGDLRRGLSVFAAANYSRLVGDFADSPIVDDRGSANQWFGAVGLGYTF